MALLRQSAESEAAGATRVSASMAADAGSGAINQFALVEDSDCRARGVGDFLNPLGNQFSGGSEIELQGLNQFLGFYNRGKVLCEVGMDFLPAQPVIVLLEHIRR